MPRTTGFTYLFAIDSKRVKSCSDWSICGSKSIELLMMSKACIFHRGSKGITNSSGLKNETKNFGVKLLARQISVDNFHCFNLTTFSPDGEEVAQRNAGFSPWY